MTQPLTQAFIFPGQGSQVVGMGKDLAANFPIARDVFAEVDAALSQNLSQLMFEGPADQLTLTENAQPAIMAASIAALRVLGQEAGMTVAANATFVAGHSLGEYTALCAAGSISLTETARLLRVRGAAMQCAVPAGNGAMAALLGVDYDIACDIANEAADQDVCSVANDNAPGQVVVSGVKAAVERAVEIAKGKGAKRAVMLQVSAPFHCPLMAPAAGIMDEALSAATIRMPVVPLVANITASAVVDPATIRELLVAQVTGVVRWRETIEYLKAQGVTRTVEIGAGKVLSGLNKRIVSDMESVNFGEAADLSFFLNARAA